MKINKKTPLQRYFFIFSVIFFCFLAKKQIAAWPLASVQVNDEKLYRNR